MVAQLFKRNVTNKTTLIFYLQLKNSLNSKATTPNCIFWVAKQNTR